MYPVDPKSLEETKILKEDMGILCMWHDQLQPPSIGGTKKRYICDVVKGGIRDALDKIPPPDMARENVLNLPRSRIFTLDEGLSNWVSLTMEGMDSTNLGDALLFVVPDGEHRTCELGSIYPGTRHERVVLSCQK